MGNPFRPPRFPHAARFSRRFAAFALVLCLAALIVVTAASPPATPYLVLVLIVSTGFASCCRSGRGRAWCSLRLMGSGGRA